MRLRVLLVAVAMVAAGGAAAWWALHEPAPRDAPIEAALAPEPPPATASSGTPAPRAEPVPTSPPVRLPALRGDLALAGRVIDEAGKPVAGATVKLASESVLSLSPLVKRLCDCSCGELLIRCQCARAKKLLPELVKKADAEPPAQATTTSAADGSFAFAKLPSDRYRVWARAAGRAAGWISNVAVGAAAKPDPTEITLAPAVEVHGSVKSSTNTPLPGVTVVALSDLEVGGIGRVLSATDGRFRIPSLGTATYYLHASARGFASALESNVDPGSDVVLTLERGGVLAGHVEDARGAGVGDALVQVIGAESENPRTRADGSFRVEDLAAGKYKVWAEKGTQTSEKIQQVEIARGESKEDLVLHLDEGASISGRAFTSGNLAPVVGAKIGLHQEHRGAVREAWSDGDGHFALTGVPPGTYELQVDASDARLPKELNVTVAAREVRTVDLALEHGATLEGRVVDSSGAPIAGADVAPDDRSQKKGKTDLKGEFRIEGLAGVADPRWGAARTKSEGGLGVVVSHAAFTAKRVEAPGLEPGKSARIDVVLARGGAILGQVLGPEDEPLDGISVSVTRHTEPEVGAGKAGRRTHVDTDDFADARLPEVKTKRGGRFELRGVPDGSFDVVANGKGMIRLAQGPVEISGEQTVDGILLRLTLGEVIEGQVVDSKGVPIESAYVYAVTEDETRAMARGYGNHASSDRDGHFHLAGLEPGTYTLSAGHEGHVHTQVRGVRSGSTDARVELATAAKLVGRVVDAVTGEPLQSFRVDYRPFTSADGSFAFTGLSRDNEKVTVSAPGYGSQSLGPFHATTGEIDAGTIRLAKGATVNGHVVGADGKPLAGVMVMPMRTGDEGNFSDDGGEPTTTDAKGAFSITGLGAGAWTLMATDTDGEGGLGGMASTTLEIAGGETRNGVVLKGGDLSGMRDMMAKGLRQTLLGDASPADAKRLGPAVDTVVGALTEMMASAGGDMHEDDPAAWIGKLQAAIPADDRTAEVDEVLAKLRAQGEAAAKAAQ